MIWWVSGEHPHRRARGVGLLDLHPRHPERAAGRRQGARDHRGGIGVPRDRPRDRLPADALLGILHARDRGDAARRAGGAPAWGPEILSRHVRFTNLDELPELYATWERWAAAVSESHTGYPSLMWFRSPEPTRSWLLALVAILDAAALHLPCRPERRPAPGPALPSHGHQLPALARRRAAHPLRRRPAADRRRSGSPRRSSTRLRPPRVGRTSRSSRPERTRLGATSRAGA